MRGISREAARERSSGKVWFNPVATLSWYYSQEDQRLGPVSEEELKRLAGEGTITPMTRVWKDGMADWQPWGSVVTAMFPDSILCHACNRPFPKDDLGAFLFLLSFASLLGAIIVGHRAATILSVHRIGKETVTFGRVSPDYIGSLPHWPGGPAL
jgi:hypothetical protein